MTMLTFLIRRSIPLLAAFALMLGFQAVAQEQSEDVPEATEEEAIEGEEQTSEEKMKPEEGETEEEGEEEPESEDELPPEGETTPPEL